MNSGDTTQHGADLPSWQSVAGGRSQKDILSTLSRQAPNQVSERKFAKNVLKRFSRRPAVQERGSGRESGSQERVSPRSKQPSNTPSAEHRPATESPLGKRRSGAKTRSDLPAFLRKDRFVFLRLFLLAPADRSRVRLRPVHGTGTLPDAGGAGGGGHATRLPRPRNAPQRGTLPDAGGAGGGGHATRLPRPRGA